MKTTMTAALAAMMCVGVLWAERPNATAFAGVSDVVKNSGIKGGIIVHLDCNVGKETAKLRINNNLSVQGLDIQGVGVPDLGQRPKPATSNTVV